MPDLKERITGLFPVFNYLPEQSLKTLIDSATILCYPAGSILSNEKYQCPFIPLVLSGGLRIYMVSPEGREITLYYAKTGDCCLQGIACRMKQGELPALVEAYENVELFTIPAAYYESILEKNTEWNRFIFNSLYQHLFDSMSTFEQLIFTRLDQRLAMFLLKRCRGKECTIYITHEQIASRLNTAREVVSRIMADLKRRNVISYERGKVRIQNIDSLNELAGNRVKNCRI